MADDTLVDTLRELCTVSPSILLQVERNREIWYHLMTGKPFQHINWQPEDPDLLMDEGL
jgi:hypothetical protein